MFQFEGKYINPQSALMYKGVEVPMTIVKEIRALDNKRFIITINDEISYPGTISAMSKECYIVLVNKARSKKLKLTFGDIVSVKMIQDTSEFGMPIPDEMQMVLDEDPEGSDLLKSLTPGKIRSLIHLVAKVKNPDKRIEKSVVIMEHLRANNGQLDYKMLNVAFKEYNNMG